MGIESLSGITGASSYQASTAKQVQPAKKSEVNVDVVHSEAANIETSSKIVAQRQQDSKNDDFLNKEKSSQKNDANFKDVAKDVNRVINQNTIAEFGYHEETHRVIIKIKDKNTDEVIKEIPSEKALEMLEKAWEIAGILVDERR